ncbi:MAG: aminoacyl-tRNA hydrolase [Parcubacteria group bacterium]
MLLIVGLGNPGDKYIGTRHNIGFAVVDGFANEVGLSFEYYKKLDAYIARGDWNEHELIILKPKTFMNNSGLAIKKFLDFYKNTPDKMIVVHDDLDLPFGTVKMSHSSSSAGHNGVESIVDHLKTQEFSRLRIGVANGVLDRARKQEPVAVKKKAVGDFVLSKFGFFEKVKLKKVLERAIEALKNLDT